ncbi:MAG: hypothetical protein ACP5O8_03565 [Candidatus Aenigmatarchaeota archaeon]
MFKKIFAIVLALIFLREAIATKGIGLGPLENNVTLSAGEEHIFYLLLFNPSDSNVNVSLKVYCLNCLRDFKFLGISGKVNLTQNFVVLPSEIEVEKNTSYLEGKFVEVRVKIPYFVEEQLIFENRTIPWLGLASGLEELNFNIIASTGDRMQVSLVSKLNVKVKSESFAWIIIPILLLIALFSIKKLRR